MESHTVDVPIVGHSVRFELQRKAEQFGSALVDHWWIDLRLLTPKPGRSMEAYQAVCDAFRALAIEPDNLLHLSDDVMETHVLARLQPWVRALAAQKVFADARLKSARKVNAERLDNLSEFLRHDDLQPVTENQFHLETEKHLRAVVLTDDHCRRYQDFCNELFDGLHRLWLDRPENVVAEARQRWTAWTTGFGRRKGREDDKLVLDVLSYESGAAWRRCYSACWTKILPVLQPQFQLSRISYRFLEYWHQQVLRERWNGKFDLFHGHVLGLHPAVAPFVQTPEGRDLLGDWLVDAVPPPHLRAEEYAEWASTLPTRRPYQRLLRGLMLAVLTYSFDRDDTNSARRGRVTEAVRRMAEANHLRRGAENPETESDEADD